MDPFELYLLHSKTNGHSMSLARYKGNIAINEAVVEEDVMGTLSKFGTQIEHSLLGACDRPDDEQLREFGSRLFEMCISKDIAELYRQIPGDDTVSIQVMCNSSKLESLPLEYLQSPNSDDWPRLDRTVVRIVPTINAPKFAGPFNTPKVLRVLLVSANPKDTRKISAEGERQRIEEAFSAWISPENVKLTVVEQATYERCHDALMTVKPHIFHFSGHGQINTKGKVELLFETDKRGSQPTPANKLCGLLRGRDIRLAIFSSCYSGATPLKSDFVSLTKVLVKEGIVPAVLANQFAIPDQTVANYIGKFYKQLLATGSVDLATAEARVALNDAFGDYSALEWGIPVLYRHSKANLIFA